MAVDQTGAVGTELGGLGAITHDERLHVGADQRPNSGLPLFAHDHRRHLGSELVADQGGHLLEVLARVGLAALFQGTAVEVIEQASIDWALDALGSVLADSTLLGGLLGAVGLRAVAQLDGHLVTP